MDLVIHVSGEQRHGREDGVSPRAQQQQAQLAEPALRASALWGCPGDTTVLGDAVGGREGEG